MMTSKEIRQSFKDFFQSKEHHIVPSAPMVINDPTLMFTNAGMNQFKVILGNALVKYPRVADSQKCLRVSGKHNDLEEVGHDTYHHTMFEMLGNWSFGNYFKKEAIAWAWEYLTEVLKLDKERLYVTVFEGAADEKLERDDEAASYWEVYLPKGRIINGNKKDNFWEMGDTGPCGPCSEIHVDIRPDSERAAVDGLTLVNQSHPQVIEIWNLVFMQYNRKSDGSLEPLPQRLSILAWDSSVSAWPCRVNCRTTTQTCFSRSSKDWRDQQRPVRQRCQKRHRHAGYCRPPAHHRFFYYRRSAAIECQGRLRDPSHSPPGRTLWLHLPGNA